MIWKLFKLQLRRIYKVTEVCFSVMLGRMCTILPDKNVTKKIMNIPQLWPIRETTLLSSPTPIPPDSPDVMANENLNQFYAPRAIVSRAHLMRDAYTTRSKVLGRPLHRVCCTNKFGPKNKRICSLRLYRN